MFSFAVTEDYCFLVSKESIWGVCVQKVTANGFVQMYYYMCLSSFKNDVFWEAKREPFLWFIPHTGPNWVRLKRAVNSVPKFSIPQGWQGPSHLSHLAYCFPSTSWQVDGFHAAEIQIQACDTSTPKGGSATWSNILILIWLYMGISPAINRMENYAVTWTTC